MADVRPLPALRYGSDIDLHRVICPPFDTISPEEQRRLYRLEPRNAVRLELPKGGDPYKAAAKTLRQWLKKGTLIHEETPAFYVYEQAFHHAGESYRRRVLFGRLRVEPWDTGVVLPHERTFSAPKEDRLNLLRTLRLNTSPVFLMYPDSQHQVAPLIARAMSLPPDVKFAHDGLEDRLWRIDDPLTTAAISRGLQSEKLYVADGHHRYETALAYSEERLAGVPRSGDAPEEFALVALAAVDDPGLLVLPIHRLVDLDLPLVDAFDALSPLFEIEPRPSLVDLLHVMADRGRIVNCFGLIAAESPDFYLLTMVDSDAAAPYLPSGRSPAWRRLDAAIATHVILRHGLGLSDTQMEDTRTVWFSEDAEAAETVVRKRRARFALLLNPISPRHVLAIADRGERMPQKSTFFYPKIPTGLLFNPLFVP